MGVTLSAGRSFSWFKDVFAGQASFDELISDIGHSVRGRGLLFTPYLSGRELLMPTQIFAPASSGWTAHIHGRTLSEPLLKALHSPFMKALNNSVPGKRHQPCDFNRRRRQKQSMAANPGGYLQRRHHQTDKRTGAGIRCSHDRGRRVRLVSVA